MASMRKSRLDKSKLSVLRNKNTELSKEDLIVLGDELVSSTIEGFTEELNNNPKLEKLVKSNLVAIKEFFIGFKEGVDAEFQKYAQTINEPFEKTLANLEKIRQPDTPLFAGSPQRVPVGQPAPRNPLEEVLNRKPVFVQPKNTFTGNAKDFGVAVLGKLFGLDEFSKGIIEERRKKQAFVETEQKLRPGASRQELERDYGQITKAEKELTTLSENESKLKQQGYSSEQIDKILDLTNKQTEILQILQRTDISRIPSDIPVPAGLQEELQNEQALYNEKMLDEQEDQSELLKEIRDLLKTPSKKSSSGGMTAGPSIVAPQLPDIPDIPDGDDKDKKDKKDKKDNKDKKDKKDKKDDKDKKGKTKKPTTSRPQPRTPTTPRVPTPSVPGTPRVPTPSVPGAGSAAGRILTQAAPLAFKAVTKAAPWLAAGAAVYDGVSDLAEGKKVESLGDVVPEGWNVINPASWAMRGGMYVGDKINKGYGAVSEALGGSGSLGGDIYEGVQGVKNFLGFGTPKIEAGKGVFAKNLSEYGDKKGSPPENKPKSSDRREIERGDSTFLGQKIVYSNEDGVKTINGRQVSDDEYKNIKTSLDHYSNPDKHPEYSKIFESELEKEKQKSAAQGFTLSADDNFAKISAEMYANTAIRENFVKPQIASLIASVETRPIFQGVKKDKKPEVVTPTPKTPDIPFDATTVAGATGEFVVPEPVEKKEVNAIAASDLTDPEAAMFESAKQEKALREQRNKPSMAPAGVSADGIGKLPDPDQEMGLVKPTTDVKIAPPTAKDLAPSSTPAPSANVTPATPVSTGVDLSKFPNWAKELKSYKIGSTPVADQVENFPGIEEEFIKLAKNYVPRSDSWLSIEAARRKLRLQAQVNSANLQKGGKVTVGSKVREQARKDNATPTPIPFEPASSANVTPTTPTTSQPTELRKEVPGVFKEVPKPEVVSKPSGEKDLRTRYSEADSKLQIAKQNFQKFEEGAQKGEYTEDDALGIRTYKDPKKEAESIRLFQEVNKAELEIQQIINERKKQDGVLGEEGYVNPNVSLARQQMQRSRGSLDDLGKMFSALIKAGYKEEQFATDSDTNYALIGNKKYNQFKIKAVYERDIKRELGEPAKSTSQPTNTASTPAPSANATPTTSQPTELRKEVPGVFKEVPKPATTEISLDDEDFADVDGELVNSASGISETLDLGSASDSQAAPPTMPDVADLQPGERKDLGQGQIVSKNKDGTVTLSGGFGSYTYDKTGKAIKYDSPRFAGLQKSTDLITGKTTESFMQGPMSVKQGPNGEIEAEYDFGLAVAKISKGPDTEAALLAVPQTTPVTPTTSQPTELRKEVPGVFKEVPKPATTEISLDDEDFADVDGELVNSASGATENLDLSSVLSSELTTQLSRTPEDIKREEIERAALGEFGVRDAAATTSYSATAATAHSEMLSKYGLSNETVKRIEEYKKTGNGDREEILKMVRGDSSYQNLLNNKNPLSFKTGKEIPQSLSTAPIDPSLSEAASAMGKNIVVNVPAPNVVVPPQNQTVMSPPFTNNVRNRDDSISGFIKSRYSF